MWYGSKDATKFVNCDHVVSIQRRSPISGKYVIEVKTINGDILTLLETNDEDVCKKNMLHMIRKLNPLTED